MPAASLQPVPPGYRSPLTWSVIGHVVLAVLFSSSIAFLPQQEFQQLAIEAVVIDQGAIDRAAEQERQAAAEAAQQRAADQRRREAEQREREQQAAQQREAAEVARQKRLADERAAEQKRREQAEQQRRAAEAEAAERQRREAELAAQRAEAQRQAEARARAAAEKREQQRRQAELAAALEAEEALLAAQQSGEMNRYKALIQQRVQRNWKQPPSAVAGVECQVSVQQLPSGEVVRAQVTRCNGDEIVRRSVENAVYAASPLPLPDDRRLFDRNLTFIFRPQIEN